MGYLLIIRPLNCLLTFIAVLVGAWIGQDIVIPPLLILAGVIGFIVCAFGNIINDLYDIEIDRINNPNRPLPSGRVNKKIIEILAGLFFVSALLFSCRLGALPFFIVLGALLLLFFYAAYLKKIILGNFVVALITGLSFILGGLVMKNSFCIWASFFSFFIHFSREIIKDVIDIKGDKSREIRSLPIIFGVKWACNISVMALAILCIIIILPLILKILGLPYLLTVLLSAYPIIIFTILRLLKNPPLEELKRLSNLLKISMVIGLVAMVL